MSSQKERTKLTHRFRIYWWAKTEVPKKYGHDDVELEQDELDEWGMRVLGLVNEAQNKPGSPEKDSVSGRTSPSVSEQR